MSSEPFRIDPSKMKTQAARDLAAKVEARIAASDAQIHRYVRVLEEYLFYTHQFQLALADAAIIGTLAALATNNRRDECKAYFDALIEMMYASTDASGSRSMSRQMTSGSV